jgi:AcrR family transcriptional regulator
MKEAVQPRTLKTRARLITAAQDVIDETGFAAMRVDEVVRRAGVAKGTFFAHFRDKDALMDQLIGARIETYLDSMAKSPPPATVLELVARLEPLMTFMTQERYVFDVILRYSGAAAREDVGPIAATFIHFVEVVAPWLGQASFRKDTDPATLAEGVLAFMINSMALNFCSLHEDSPLAQNLQRFLTLWLEPKSRLEP